METVREGVTKKGVAYSIRYAQIGDAEGARNFINKLSKERTFIRFQGEEVTLEEEQKVVDKWVQKASEGKGLALFLIVDGAIAGISDVMLEAKTESHVALLGLSIDQSLRGQGLGEILMRAVIEEAKVRLTGLRLITLKVKAPNEIARALYTKLGFKQYGELPLGTMHQDVLVNEVMMYLDVADYR